MPPLVRAIAAAAAVAARATKPGWFLGPVLPTYIARTQNGAPPQFGISLSGGEFLYQYSCNKRIKTEFKFCAKIEIAFPQVLAIRS